ncbi:unnamed protein product [Arabidopsis arenosa]|uniref:Retroviral polymerase SH3-like domain-containing protein n=1 Tax=Arabidopsis arenosa TaxID=38785 RepID=A0A8S1ZM06_ARAAE|nr:unnamed protein product [Arabidopsis arenosa]
MLNQQGMKKTLLDTKPEAISQYDWDEMREKACSTIRTCLGNEVVHQVLEFKYSANYTVVAAVTTLKAMDSTFRFETDDENCVNNAEKDTTLMKCQISKRNFYRLLGNVVCCGAAAIVTESDSTTLWHMRLGLIGELDLTELYKRDFYGLKSCKIEFSKFYVMGKHSKASFKAGLPKVFWAEVVNMVVCLINRLPRASLERKVVEEVWTGVDIDLSNLRIFCCPTYLLIPNDEITKLDSKSKKYVFLRFEKFVKGFKLWDHEARKRGISRDVVFDEQYMLQEASSERVFVIIEADTGSEIAEDEKESSEDRPITEVDEQSSKVDCSL